MAKVKVTIVEQLPGGESKRDYEGDFAFVYLLNEDGSGRWLQSPLNWKNGIGLFFAAVEALMEVSAGKGNELFRLAARKATKLIYRLEQRFGFISGGEKQD